MATNGREKGRAASDNALVLALASGASTSEAVERTGIGARTIHRRKKDPEFAAKVAAVRSEMFAQGVGRLAENQALAADKLKELLKSENHSVQLGAARSILDLGSRLRETQELAERVLALEQKYGDEPESTADEDREA